MVESVDGYVESPPLGVGARLAAARAEQNLSLDDIAGRTRIPRRHLESLERNDTESMPGSTYAIGFAKSYARAVGLDANEIAHALRIEMGGGDPSRRQIVDTGPADPLRVPPRLLAIVFVILAILVAGGYGLWRSGAFGDDAETRARLAAGTAEMPVSTTPAGSIGGVTPPIAPPAAVSANAPVAVTANALVWLKIYEMGGATLFQGEMKPGQRFDVPATTVDPRIRTGRPQAVTVTVGQIAVPPLGEPDRIIRDVSLKATALLAPAGSAPAAASGRLVPLVPKPASHP